jgi:hypothetical protein
MARPTAQNLNRSVGVSSDRTTQAPGLAVQAPLNVNVGPNNLQALADILGVGASIAIDRERQRNAERVQEETEALATKAEADFHGGRFDEEEYRRSRTYRKTHDTLAGARQGVEGRLAMRKAVEDFVTANPYADEAAVREQLEFARLSVLMGEDGQYKPEFQNERVRAIAENALMEEGYEFISKWRKPYTDRMQAKGASEAEGLFVATGLAEGTTTVANMNATAEQLRRLGVSPEEINRRLTTSVIALSRELRKPELIDQLPTAWTDGSVGPRADSGLLAEMDQQQTIITNLKETEDREKQWGERYAFSSQVQALIAEGKPLPPELRAQAQALGYSPEAYAEWEDQSRRMAAAILEEQERAAEEAAKDEVEFEEYLDDPYGIPTDQAEKRLGVQYKLAMERGDTKAMAEILRVGSQNGHLPANLRRYLNNAPVNFNQFGQWHQQMKTIDQMDDELYASLQQDARIAYEAYNGLIASARFSPEEAFRRIQARDAGRAGEFIRAQTKSIQQMVGKEGSLMQTKVKERMYAFAALSDLDDATVLQLTRDSIARDYITDNGRLLPRQYFPNAGAVRHAKDYYALVQKNKGKIIDPEDVIIALPEGTSDVLFYDRRDPTRVQRLPAERLVAIRRDNARKAQERAAAPQRAAEQAVKQRLYPWRNIPGESGWEKRKRVSRELGVLNRERRAQGLDTIASTISWQNAYGRQ